MNGVGTSTVRLAGVGVFVVGGLLLFAIGLFMIGDRQMAFGRKFVVYTEFARIPGLEPGAIIRVSGAKAGTVKEILPPNRPSEKFRVRLELTETLRPLVRTDSVATIETEGLVGGTFLAVGTGSDRAERAPENSTIPSKEPFAITDLLQQMSDTVSKINTTIDDLKGDVQRAVVSIADTVENANDVIMSVQDDVKTMASAGARISNDAAEISDTIRSGKGTIGRLLNDDELYQRAASVAKSAEDIAANARQVMEHARQVMERARQSLDALERKDGPVQGITEDVRETLNGARVAMSGFAENMEALKRNFLFRGFFNSRGYFALSDLSPAEYRQGGLGRGNNRRVLHVWFKADALFEEAAGESIVERLTDAGKGQLDAAISPYLDRISKAIVVVEGYSQTGATDQQYLRSRARAAAAADYLIGKFRLDPGRAGIMALGAKTAGHPTDPEWDGVAIAVYLDKKIATQAGK
jgi:phospholipid/cholesterol/gamma-HCH transport system substrate-binding protein